MFFFFHLLLSPLESIQNKKPIFGEENLHFFALLQLVYRLARQNHCKKEKEQKCKIFHKLTSTPSSGGRPSFQKKFTIISVGKLTHKTF
jgi:hypothetical protein